MRKINKKFAREFSPAFTLIEVVMAVTLITIVMTAVYGLVISIITANQRNIHSLQASALASEGLEIVRFMRDSNWLQNYQWDGGSGAKGFNFETYLNGDAFYLEESTSSPYWGISATPIENGLFTRKITISEVENLEVDSHSYMVYEVLSTVSWKERGVDRNVEVSTFLTDWHD